MSRRISPYRLSIEFTICKARLGLGPYDFAFAPFPADIRLSSSRGIMSFAGLNNRHEGGGSDVKDRAQGFFEERVKPQEA